MAISFLGIVAMFGDQILAIAGGEYSIFFFTYLFENKALRRILGVKWWHRVSIDRVRKITGVQPVDEYVRLSRWQWLGHVFRREGVIVRGNTRLASAG